MVYEWMKKIDDAPLGPAKEWHSKLNVEQGDKPTPTV